MPFNPSLINQVSFYAKRLKHESSVRRLGFILVVLTMLLQLFAVLSPSQPSLAESPNDIIRGGVASVDALKFDYNANAGGDLQAILNYYGVGIDQINQAVPATVDTTTPHNPEFYSIGRTIANRSDSIQIPIPNTVTPIYMRTLIGWDHAVWQAYRVPSTRLGQIWILKDCGNVVTAGIPPTGKPNPHIIKNANPRSGSTVHPGDRINYKLIFDNTGQAPAMNFKITDNAPSQVNNLQPGDTGVTQIIQGQTYIALWDKAPNPSNLGPNPTQNYQANFWVTVRPDVKPGTFCNSALLTAEGISITSNRVCHTVPACPFNPAITDVSAACKPPPTPGAVCTVLNAKFVSRTKVEFEARAVATGGATISAFEFTPGTGKAPETVKVTASTGAVAKKFTFDYPGSPAPATYHAKVAAVSSVGTKTATTCARDIVIEKQKTPLVTIEKSAFISSPQTKSAEIKADPGQEFSFVFTITNAGDADAVNYALPQDTINDTLEYADVVNANDAKVVTQGSTTILLWKPVTIKAGSTITKTVTFRMKNPIPVTNTPPGDPQSFDCKIQNSIASSTVIVDIDQTHCVNKVIEQTAANLPNTGPGASLLIGFSLTAIVGYFFARSRLMSKELEIVRSEYTTSGGMWWQSTNQ